MPTILHFETPRRKGADPVPPAGEFQTAMPVRSLGRFTVRVDRKGGPVAYLFSVGEELICTAFRETDGVRWEREKRIGWVEAKADAIREAWQEQIDAWNANDCKGPAPQIGEEFRSLCRTLREMQIGHHGPVETTVERALAAWCMAPLTDGERNQLRAIDFPGRCE